MRYGLKLKCDLEDWLGQVVCLSGVYEGPTAAIVAELVKRGDVVVDVGANAGFFTRVAASRVDPSRTVLSFEPAPSVRSLLRDNVLLNSFANVDTHEVALSSTKGNASFNEGSAAHRGTSSLRPTEISAGSCSVANSHLMTLPAT
jgi:FkbM family methyltransferase